MQDRVYSVHKIARLALIKNATICFLKSALKLAADLKLEVCVSCQKLPYVARVVGLRLLLAVAGHFVFRHAGDANEAFKQLPGAQDADSFGRAQKHLKLTSGDHSLSQTGCQFSGFACASLC